eukprot:CAMPEP_0197662958 /NCGR_PEP_ID=MMETSP1338-20131121/55524_1 /TAXON_ID=43686 ORGANISM="Pelagodinium beii, Strain RCC1491" /NCGR_SAMPLE_ID=MMETSP1338 /ASSEMBLY_ACC=CAM_ASM_000754 /LENGTH=38 /DNA_ID= /DNA_START= /DNA_END= /DNA_ORIENTATION=
MSNGVSSVLDLGSTCAPLDISSATVGKSPTLAKRCSAV